MTRSKWRRFAKAALIVIAIGLLFLFCWPIMLFLLRRTAFSHVVTNLADASGWSPLLLKAVVLVVMLPFFWALMNLLKFDLLAIFSRKKRRVRWALRKLTYAILVFYLAGYWFTLYLASRNTYFGHSSGEPTKYYALTPEGVRWFDSPGFDPKYGLALQPATPQIVANLERAESGQIPRRLILQPGVEPQFFDPLSGAPRVWYYRGHGGEIQLFSGPGLHPAYGVALEPVDQHLAERLVQEARVAAVALAEEAQRQQAADRGEFFDQDSGEPIRYFARTPEGIRWFDGPGFDPKYGIELEPATPEMVAMLERAERGLLPERLDVEDSSQVSFFDPLTGKPRVWYFETPSGALEFYNAPGSHPGSGEELLPVNGQVVAAFEARAERGRAAQTERQAQARRERYFNLSESGAPVAVTIVKDGRIDTALSQYVAERMGGTASFFKPTFVEDGLFHQLYSGRAEGLRELGLAQLPGKLVLGEWRAASGHSNLRENLLRTEATIEMRAIETAKGFESQVTTGMGIAARFTEAESMRDAARQAADDALSRLHQG